MDGATHFFDGKGNRIIGEKSKEPEKNHNQSFVSELRVSEQIGEVAKIGASLRLFLGDIDALDVSQVVGGPDFCYFFIEKFHFLKQIELKRRSSIEHRNNPKNLLRHVKFLDRHQITRRLTKTVVHQKKAEQ